MFSLGTFLTIAYYGLVHFNAKNVAAWEEKYKAGDKFVYALQHLEHIFALPMVFLYASYFQLSSPPRSDVVFYTGGFAFFYVCFAVVINKLTDEWLYNVFGDVEAAGGFLALLFLFLCLIGAFVGLGYVGCWLHDLLLSKSNKGSKQE